MEWSQMLRLDFWHELLIFIQSYGQDSLCNTKVYLHKRKTIPLIYGSQAIFQSILADQCVGLSLYWGMLYNVVKGKLRMFAFVEKERILIEMVVIWCNVVNICGLLLRLLMSWHHSWWGTNLLRSSMSLLGEFTFLSVTFNFIISPIPRMYFAICCQPFF